MSWAKLDDQLHGNRKIKRAWKTRAALGLHLMAMSYSACYDLDGFVPEEFVEEKLPVARERDAAVAALTFVPTGCSAGLWETVNGGWLIHDWEQYNGDATTREEMRAAKSAAGKRGAAARWGARAGESTTDSSGMAPAIAGDGTAIAACHPSANGTAMAPSPSPSQLPPNPPKPKVSEVEQKAVALGFDEWLEDHRAVTGKTIPAPGTKSRTTLAGQYVACCAEVPADMEPLVALKLATRGAFNDPHRRANGYDGAENVLRATKVLNLIDNGRRAASGARPDRPPTVADIQAAQRARQAAERDERPEAA